MGGGKMRALCARPAERAPIWGPGGGMPPMRRRSRGRRGGRPRIALGRQGPGAASAVPPPLVGGGRRRAARAWIARLVRATIRIKGGPQPAAPHTSDVPQLPSAARDNERRAHGPCAHASGANRRTQYRAARRRRATLRQFAAGASAPMGRSAERRQGGRECVRPWRRDRESFCGREASAKAGTPRGKPTPNGRRLPRPGRSFVPARRPFPARRRWPPARTPLLDTGTEFRQNAVSDVHEFWQKSASDVRHTARMKHYMGDQWELMVCSKPFFKEDGWEQSGWRKPAASGSRESAAKQSDAPAKPLQAAEADVDRSLRRAAAKLRDLALSNPFRYFVTLTLDQSKIDRYDMGQITKALNGWLDNHVRRDGLAYILVPERHKDGAVHFHGFFNDALSVVDSGTLDVPGSKKPRKPRSASQRAEWLAAGAHVVYNVEAWPYGFTTALELYGDYPAAVAYVCKYVRKQREKIGGRWWYHGGKLNGPAVSYPDVEYREIAESGAGYGFAVPGAAFVIVRPERRRGGEQACGNPCGANEEAGRPHGEGRAAAPTGAQGRRRSSTENYADVPCADAGKGVERGG